jgi:hypothetical protein
MRYSKAENIFGTTGKAAILSKIRGLFNCEIAKIFITVVF